MFKKQGTSVAKARKSIAEYRKTVEALPEQRRSALFGRLDAVRRLGHNLGYGVGDDMDDLLAEYGLDGRSR